MMDLDSPLHVMVLEKIIKNAGIAQVFEEMLPIPEGYSTEIGVELGDV
jgi:ABC-type protease/lipase transport system fused ATPase/permease subunit